MTVPPFPPSDNLYKFVALVGVLLIVICQLYPVNREQELAIRLIQVNGEVNQYNIAVGHLNEDAAATNAVLKNFFAGNKDETMARFQTKNRDIQLQLSSLEEKKAEIAELDRQLTKWRVIGMLGTIVGVVLAIVGFVLWYRRVQHPQDIILGRQAK